MTQTKFDNLSLLARIAYGIMSAENYVLKLYPTRNWKPFFKKFWSITTEGVYWDEWSYEIMEIIPEYLFEFDNYKDAQFEYLSENEYNFYVNLLKDTSKSLNDILMFTNHILEPYLYTEITDNYLSTIPELTKIDEILSFENIDLPDITKVASSNCNEDRGFGNSLDAKSISKFLQ